MKKRVALEIVVKAIAFAMGLAFPYVRIWWKIVFLVVYLLLRVWDLDKGRRWNSVSPFFFIGMIIAYIVIMIIRRDMLYY
jgi:uncharacterized membrane protein (DUF2068 family)